MTNSQRLEAVRRHLQAWFSTQTDGQPWESSESILIRGGFYCGRRFQLPGFRAVWFFEEDEIKVYRATGELEATFRGDQLLNEPACEPTLRIEDARDAAAEKEAAEANEQPSRRAA